MLRRLLPFAAAATPAVALAHPVIDATLPARVHRQADAPPLSAKTYADALAGKVVTGIEHVTGVAAAKAWGVAVVDSPIEATWMAINDESRLAGRMPVSVSTVIGGRPLGTPRRVFEYLPLGVPFVGDRWWIVDMTATVELYRADPRLWELAWTDATDPTNLAGTDWEAKAAEGIPVAWTKGSWLLVDLGDERTLVEYYSWSDPGGSLPAGPASRFGGSAVTQALQAVAELAKESEAMRRTGYTRPDGTPL